MSSSLKSLSLQDARGSPIGELIAENPNLGWPWIFWIKYTSTRFKDAALNLTITSTILSAAFCLGLAFMPETLPRVVIARSAGGNHSPAASDETPPPPDYSIHHLVPPPRISPWRNLRTIATLALRIMLTEPIVAFLAIYNGFS